MRHGDDTEIRRLAVAVASAHHRLDATGLSALYADDADWTDASGVTRRGRAAVVAHLSAHFAYAAAVPEGPFAPPAAEVRFVHDDIAVVRVRPGPEGAAALLVVRREGERWLIVAETR